MTRTLITSAMMMVASTASASGPIVFHLSDPPMARIHTNDVDLRSPAGRGALENRIQIAARQVCADVESDPGPPNPMDGYNRCYRFAVAKGVAQLDQLSSQ